MAQGETKGQRAGELRAKIDILLRQLSNRFGTLPSDMVDTIRATHENLHLNHWLDLLVTTASLDEFRQQGSI